MAKVKESHDDKPPWYPTALTSKAEKKPVKTGVYLTDDAHRRLQTASLVLGLDYSVIVDALLRWNLIGFYSGWRKGGDGEGVPPAQNNAA